MTIDKLKALEPLFGSWYVDSKLAEGRNSKVFKVYKISEGKTEFLALKAVKYPASDRELSRVIESGRYKTVDEYLDMLAKTVTENMSKMLSLRTCSNIVRYDNYKIVRESSCFYVLMLMELLTPFSDYIKNESITSQRAAKIGTELCLAAESFRQAGIIHHQIKPDNIYTDKKGDFYLGDFGISNISERIKTEASPYMAPEVYTDSPYDTCSDVYSIGVLLYKLLNNNRLPFLPDYPNPVSISDRELAFEKQMRGENLKAPSKADDKMTTIIFKALAYKQTDRYYTPLLMRTELERYLTPVQTPVVPAGIPLQSAPLYVSVPPAPPTVIPVPPVVPVPVTPAAPQRPDTAIVKPSSPFVPEKGDIPLSSAAIAEDFKNNDIKITDAEKREYSNAFSQDEEPELQQDKDSKKIYFMVAGIILLVALIIAILFFGFSDNDASTGSTAPVTASPTVSLTAAPTVATTAAPTLATTQTTLPVTDTTTAPTTTAPTTTEPTTTAPTTTEPTTTEPTTTAPTTTEPTTTEPTTESTTEPSSFSAVFSEAPVLVDSDYIHGEEADDGRIYKDIEDYTILEAPGAEVFGKIVLDITTPLGENISSEGDAYIYEMYGSSIIQKVSANIECVKGTDSGEESILCFITVDDEDFYYTPDIYQYYVCLEEGAVSSDTVISLPLQLEV